MRIMSLDVGSQTIGVAVSDLFGWTAQGLETIRHTTREKDFERLRQLTDEYKVEEFVLGMPLNMNGTKGMRAERTEEFAAELAAAFPDIPYHFWDERLTTVMAQKQLIAADVSRKKRKKVIDKMAAVVILEGYLQHLFREKNSLSWSPFRHQKMMKKSRISFWHASILMKMEKQNTSLRRMMNMMQSQISMMRCEKHYKRAADVSAALFIKMC